MIGFAQAAIILLATAGSVAQSSSISFSSLPSVPEPVSAPRDTSDGLAGFYGLAGGVVDAIRPGNLPHDTVAKLAGTVSDQLQLDWGIPPPDTDVGGLANEFLRWLAPMIAAMVLGVVLAVAIPVAGCCILCCRACGRCGAKSKIYRKKNQNVKCVVLTSVFLATTSMIFVGATIAAVSVRHMSESLGELEQTLDTALSDVDSYFSSGAEQVCFIADNQFGVFEAHVLNDMDHIGEWFEGSIGRGFQSDALSVINQASSLLASLMAIDDLVSGGNALIGDLRNTTESLVSEVSSLRTDMEALQSACTDHGLGSECEFLSSTNFAVTVNFTEIKDIEFNDEVQFGVIEEKIRTATDIFKDMAQFIDTEAEAFGLSQKAKSEFSNVHSTLEYDYLNALNETIENIVSDGGHIDTARDDIHDALKYLDKYEALWNGVGILLVYMFFLIIVFFVSGSFCGSFGYSREAQPHSRSSVSNCGGRCVLVGIFIAFAASPVLLMATSASLGLATGIQKLCEDLQPPDYPVLREVVDDPEVWGGLTLVGLVTREETDATVNLSVYQSLSQCAQNEPLWKALDGDRLYSFSDFDDAFNCTSFGVGSEDFRPFDGFNSDDIFPHLTDVNESFSSIDFRELMETINETHFLSFDLEELRTNLTRIINTPVNTTVHELAAQILDGLEQIESLVQDLQTLQERLRGNVTQLQNLIESSENEVLVFNDNLDAFLVELHDTVDKATDDYIGHLCGFVDDYINYANDTIRNELGRCGVFPAAYAAVYSTVCENAVDGLNGYWLGVGWSMLFTMVAVVVGAVLSDYFRRAGTQVVRCSETTSETTSLIPQNEDDDEDVSLINMRPKGRSYPSSARALPEEQQPLHTTEMDVEW